MVFPPKFGYTLGMLAIGYRRVLVFYVLMAALGIGGLWAADGLQSILGPVPVFSSQGLVFVAAGLGLGLFLVGFSRLAAARFTWASTLSREFRALLGDLSPRQVLLVALLSSVGEELLFRGLLQPSLGLWLGAAVFALLHIGPNPRFIPWTVMALVVGLLLGALVLWTGALLPAILTHFVVNYLNLRFLTQHRRDEAFDHALASWG